MKKVFSNAELPHVWATQKQEQGQNSSKTFYFEGPTIYSYGSHFPIATIDGQNVFFTKRTYSNSTAKQVAKARQAVSHKNFIWCYEVPTKYRTDQKKYDNLKTATERNFSIWKGLLQKLFAEVANKKNRNIEDRINSTVLEVETYCNYFKCKVSDKELSTLIKLSKSENFLEVARGMEEKKMLAHNKKMAEAEKAYQKYLSLWREQKEEEIRELPDNVKTLCNFYSSQSECNTHLRYNKEQNRIETTKGVQIPVEVAKRAYIQLNGCLQKECNGLSIPVMNYSITKSTKDSIVAGCHTIPKTDVIYIAQLLNW